MSITHSRGPERSWPITPVSMRDLLAQDLVLGTHLLARAANQIPEQPEIQARTCLNSLLINRLPGFGALPFREVMLNINSTNPDRDYRLAVELFVPRHSNTGEPIKGVYGQHERKGILLGLPLTPILKALELYNHSDQAERLHSYGAPPIPLDNPGDRLDLIRLVGYTMYNRFNHGQTNNWLLSERAVEDALAGPVYCLPKIL